jgi:hypothetical protein
VLVELREARELRGDELDVVPMRQLVPRDAHRADRPVHAGLAEPVRGQLVDVHHERLFRDHVRVAVVALVHVGIERLRVAHHEAQHFGAVDEQVVAVEGARELLEHLGVVVGAHAGVDAVVPTVQAADEVVAHDVAVAEQRPAVEAAAVEHRVLVTSADDHQVDALDRRTHRGALGHLTPVGDLHHRRRHVVHTGQSAQADQRYSPVVHHPGENCAGSWSRTPDP